MKPCRLLCFLLLSTSLLRAEEKPVEQEKFYTPVEKNIEGWTIAVDPQLLEAKNSEVKEKAFIALANHLQRIKYILPEDRLVRLQQCRIWLELNNPRLAAMQYHWEEKWLLDNGHDPRLVRHVHIPRARSLYERGTWAKHPYVVLHELAHAYHEQVFGFDDEEIRAAYQAAKKSGSYEKVRGHRGDMVTHYAMTTPMEYFAENSEAYLGVNDFYPFVRAELKEHDPAMYKLLEKIWGKVP